MGSNMGHPPLCVLFFYSSCWGVKAGIHILGNPNPHPSPSPSPRPNSSIFLVDWVGSSAGLTRSVSGLHASRRPPRHPRGRGAFVLWEAAG